MDKKRNNNKKIDFNFFILQFVQLEEDYQHNLFVHFQYFHLIQKHVLNKLMLEVNFVQFHYNIDLNMHNFPRNIHQVQ